MPEKTLLPTRKVAGAGIAGAAFSLLVYILNKYVSPFREHPLSGELATWATTVLAGLTAYLVPPGASEATVRDSGTGRVRSALQREERKKLAIGTAAVVDCFGRSDIGPRSCQCVCTRGDT